MVPVDWPLKLWESDTLLSTDTQGAVPKAELCPVFTLAAVEVTRGIHQANASFFATCVVLIADSSYKVWMFPSDTVKHSNVGIINRVVFGVVLL